MKFRVEGFEDDNYFTYEEEIELTLLGYIVMICNGFYDSGETMDEENLRIFCAMKLSIDNKKGYAIITMGLGSDPLRRFSVKVIKNV